jgi:UDP-glucose:(galactosyl)LPS alpha-1,2-glucosyltransferase
MNGDCKMHYNKVFLDAVKNRFCYSFASSHVNKRVFHVGYGIDSNYVRCMGVAITSICKNNPQCSFVFHIISSELNVKHLEKLEILAKDNLIDIHIYIIDTMRFKELPTQEYFPISMYYRLILPLILQEGIVLYLDADIICLQSIEEIFYTPLDIFSIAAVLDIGTTGEKRSNALNLPGNTYFNSGVLLIDINKWNQEDILRKLMDILLNKDIELQYPDQDALNIVFQGKVHYLDDKWNTIGIVNQPDIKMKLQETKLLHFTAHPKPWSIVWKYRAHELLKDIYNVYEEQSPWQDEPLCLPSNYKHMKWYAQGLWTEGNYKLSYKWYLKYLLTKYNKFFKKRY